MMSPRWISKSPGPEFSGPAILSETEFGGFFPDRSKSFKTQVS